MGFPHDKTTHHFRVLSNGGVIEVRVNNRDDKPNIAAIRSHLKHIARMFSNGDFSTPMLVHDGAPPGTTTMKLMKTAIHYDYEEMPTGGRVRIEANDRLLWLRSMIFCVSKLRNTRRATALQSRRSDCRN